VIGYLDMLDEPVELAPYDAKWAAEFEQEAARLRSALALRTDAIAHVGSTAVPGLTSKPIVDILLGTDRFPPPKTQCNAIENLGYENLGEAGVPGRIYFRIRAGKRYNLHVTLLAGEIWNANIILRDFLRECPEAAQSYAAYKREAMTKHPHSLLAYSKHKEPIIQKLLVDARSWCEARK
jgi:GrpB-like predicted nucleotidyltransferase (UPF0157 family)